MKHFLSALLILLCLSSPSHAESVYERVIKSGTIRCAYAANPPWAKVNLKTGDVEGLSVDIFREIASSLNLKMEFVAEVGYGDFAEGLKTGHYDAFCGGITVTAPRSREASFTRPIFYASYGIHRRVGENHLNSIEAINKPEITSATIDGEVFQVYSRQFIPEATELSLPFLTDGVQPFIEVINNKADVVIRDYISFSDFNKARPGLMEPALPEPMIVSPIAYVVPNGAEELRDMIDTAIEMLLVRGVIDRILNDYGYDETAALRISKPYEIKK